MQPETFTFLQSARREAAMASALADGSSRAVFLHRAAGILGRLAFHEHGLSDLLNDILPRQWALMDRASELAGEAIGHDACAEGTSAIGQYEENRAILLYFMGRLAAGDHPDAAAVDRLFRDISQFDHDITDAIAAGATASAQTWEEGRSHADADIAVTAERLTAYLRKRYPTLRTIRCTHVARLSGMNANEAFFIDVEGHPDWPRQLILRRPLPVQIQPTRITDEFDVLTAVRDGGMPVPRPILREDDPAILGQPFLILERLAGETRAVVDMGDAGRAIFRRLAALMGQLHAMDPVILPANRRAGDASPEAWLEHRIAVYEKEWRRGAREPVLTVTAAFHWLRRNAGRFCDQQVIVHGDFDQRNLLVNDRDIVAVIDWESTHEGHPAEDLAYVKPQIEAMMPWDDFMAIYVAHGGRPVDPFQMRYADVLSNMLRVTTSMVAYSAYVDGDLDNFLMGSVRINETEAACQSLHRAISNPLPSHG